MSRQTSGLLFLLLFIAGHQFTFAQESIKTEILAEVNILRHTGCKCGDKYMPPVRPLYWSDQLEQAANRHAKDMYRNSHFDHRGTDGSGLDDRISATGYKWSMVGENIAWGYLTPEGAVEGWKSSPGHCRNMMNPLFREIGVVKRGSYWVMNLGRGAK